MPRNEVIAYLTIYIGDDTSIWLRCLDCSNHYTEAEETDVFTKLAVVKSELTDKFRMVCSGCDATVQGNLDDNDDRPFLFYKECNPSEETMKAVHELFEGIKNESRS